ncbi:MAG TPA: ParB/RepB/Spo0J family partition protein [Sphingomonadaceae bacterium]|nr:ParB/RepB/Spo0J family partition protein [Sphingomonadaceae bacterium]
MITSIPLNKLVRSPRNVRRAVDNQADLQLKADIEARGLLQNLVVTACKKPRGSFAVEAGDRRYRSLLSLAEEGKIPAGHEVPCFVLDAQPLAAQEASLAENFQHLRMNPADECLGFQHLIDHGADVEGVARRFGLSSRFVEGRLRLASLAPVVFEALGAGEISLEVAKAYAATPDRERQAYVFGEISRSYGAAHPDSIRRMMTQATASASDRRARFVGEEAYVAAGGRVERDLFADDAATRWLDVALLERLASEKLQQLSTELAVERGLAWVRPTLECRVGYAQTEGLHRVPVTSPPLTDDDIARIDDLEIQIQEHANLLEQDDLEDAARDAAEARVHDLSGQIEAIANRPPEIPHELKAQIGAFLLLDEQGSPKLDPAYYTEASPESGAAELDGDLNSSEGAGEPQRAPGLSQRLVDELAMQRRDILAVHVAADPALALDLAIFLMIDRSVGYSAEKSGASLVARPPADPVFDLKTPDAPATIARAEVAERLDRSWTQGTSRAERFDAFRMLSEASRAAWLGQAVAGTMEASVNLPGERFCAFHDHLGRILGIDVARWWRPTGANFFDRVSKGVTLGALAEVGGPALAARYAKAKKAELAQSCERIFSGDFIAEVETKEAALAWIPEAMRFAPPKGELLARDPVESSTDEPPERQAAEAIATSASEEVLEDAA